ncbi:hypothetical protein HAP48_0005050 [Bradyrhizobium septentrionale]|uniref:hypothetical protein n=1 Tax=Bradyrhizobium TaxID=374 RepID=UPI00056C29B3|nr:MULTISPECIES: hypothetical protein [Bradyrhizobium]MCK7672610.1 hypothetical protein [Bradyrhizobium sp. 2S1]UGY16879.1 hypothetical protein HAP48_0005050 [Bradyrhizobium septentrionale]UGY25644.1 hypothetical protein HU675_0001870 [Bradyrhizobium septentrionale]
MRIVGCFRLTRDLQAWPFDLIRDKPMNTSVLSTALRSIACFTSAALLQERTAAGPADDPFLWLEEIEAPRALAWARAENDKTLGVFQSDPRYRRFYEEALTILQAKEAG